GPGGGGRRRGRGHAGAGRVDVLRDLRGHVAAVKVKPGVYGDLPAVVCGHPADTTGRRHVTAGRDVTRITRAGHGGALPGSQPGPGFRYAKMSILGTFHPDTLTTAVAPCRSAEFQVTVSACDSPGNSVMSLSRQSEDCSSLSPGSSWPPAVPRRTSARSKKATVDADVLVMVTVVARSAPAGPAWLTVLAAAETDDCGSACRPVRFAYWESVPCGWPSVLDQFTASGWVDSQ